MPNAAIIQFPGRSPDGTALTLAAREMREATADACNYALVVHDFAKALKAGRTPADAAAIAVAEALRGTLAWQDEERRKYAESLEREVGRGR